MVLKTIKRVLINAWNSVLGVYSKDPLVSKRLWSKKEPVKDFTTLWLDAIEQEFSRVHPTFIHIIESISHSFVLMLPNKLCKNFSSYMYTIQDIDITSTLIVSMFLTFRCRKSNVISFSTNAPVDRVVLSRYLIINTVYRCFHQVKYFKIKWTLCFCFYFKFKFVSNK